MKKEKKVKKVKLDRSGRPTRRQMQGKIKLKRYRKLSNEEFAILFALMVMGVNMSKLKVSRAYKKYTNEKLVLYGKGQTSDTDTAFTGMPNKDTVVHGLASDLEDLLAQSLIVKGSTMTTKILQKRKLLLKALDENSNFVENVANALAESASDISAGINSITRIGYSCIIKKGSKRIVGFTDSGIGWAQAHEEKLGKGAVIQIFQHGPTTEKNISPTSTRIFITFSSDVIFSNIKSGTVYAYRNGQILPLTKKSGAIVDHAASVSTAKKASPMAASKSKHPMVDVNSDQVIVYGPWRYIIIP